MLENSVKIRDEEPHSVTDFPATPAVCAPASAPMPDPAPAPRAADKSQPITSAEEFWDRLGL